MILSFFLPLHVSLLKDRQDSSLYKHMIWQTVGPNQHFASRSSKCVRCATRFFFFFFAARGRAVRWKYSDYMQIMQLSPLRVGADLCITLILFFFFASQRLIIIFQVFLKHVPLWAKVVYIVWARGAADDVFLRAQLLARLWVCAAAVCRTK